VAFRATAVMVLALVVAVPFGVAARVQPAAARQAE
jgi:hypothetical protein